MWSMVGRIQNSRQDAARRAAEGDGIRRYVHLGTGNYNPTTARLYTDIGLLTCQPEFGEDATKLFNLLTGICAVSGHAKAVVAPFDLHDADAAIDRARNRKRAKGLARAHHRENEFARGSEIIEALYRASQAGVKIELIVRGICCLRPASRA